MNTFWKIIGALLIGWVIYDLYAGYTFVRTIVYRAEDPALYWTALSVWAVLGISCFFSWNKNE